MKKLLYIFVLFFSGLVWGQKFAYIDTNYILENLPEYTQAQEIVKKKSMEWQGEAEKMQTELTLKIDALKQERLLLTETQIQEREKEILELQKALTDFKNEIFGPEGKLIETRKGLVLPIQNKIWEAVNTIAKQRDYGFVFDRANGVSMIVTDPKYDLSKAVLNILTKQ
ncbi:MAG: hypothetical protein C4K58_04525 [Flavobacteriaceae bacterium]|nr:MAG: hypothetical protein C4K58_04525 [Flavobacteriaceae bacterium]